MPPQSAPSPTPTMRPRNRTEPGSSAVSVTMPARAQNGAATKSTNPMNDSPLLGIGRRGRPATSSNDSPPQRGHRSGV